MIKAIIFDYGNVIARVDHSIFLKRIAQRSSLSVDEIKSLAYRQRDLLVRYESGEITSRAFCASVIESCQLSISELEFKEAFQDIFERIQSTIQLIKDLKPTYKIGLLSNTSEWHFKSEIETVEVFPLFDTVTLSFEVGVMKPSSGIYVDALQKLRLQPGECVYIDDIPEYVEAAQQLGINAIHYSSHEALMLSLQKVGVNV